MKKIVFSLFLSLLSCVAMASDGGKVEAGKLYDVPSGSFDIDYMTSEAIPAGQTVVVFYYTRKQVNFTQRNFAFGSSYKEFTYANEVDADRNLVVRFYDTKGIVKTDQPLLINLYSPLEEGSQWAYVICDEADKQTVADPFGTSADDTPDLPGQTENTAIELTTDSEAVTASPSKTNATRYVIYAKFTATAEGTAIFSFPDDDVAHYIKAEGESYKTFNMENGYGVKPGVTYYVWFCYNRAASGNIRYKLELPKAGEARSTAIPVGADGSFDLHGKPSIGKDYFYNVTTWFRIEPEAIEGKHLMVITLSGDNQGEIALFAEGVTDPVKAVGIGGGNGMHPVNSSVEFDIDPEQSYHVAIMQDNVGGKASFAFKTIEPGQTLGSALEAVFGYNDGVAGCWYRYTHSGDDQIISITNVSTVYNAREGLVAMGGDVAAGFRMRQGESIYFVADGNFTIKAEAITQGMSADNPVILTLDAYGGSFSFRLNGSESDVTRYVQYTATESGTFMYGTDQRSVVEMALGATVTDRTTGRSVSVVQQKQNFGAEYYTYTWQVTAGHTYLIEQTLVNNLGNVTFMATFQPAAQGEVLENPIPVTLAESYTLGRKQNLVTYFSFTAEEEGTYQLTAHVQGYVRVYDEDGSSVSIPKDYTNGTDFHNETFRLAAGESIVFSVQPSADIEHLSVGVQDFFIPDYFVTVGRTDVEGQTFGNPMVAYEGEMYDITGTVTWYGPITIPAGEYFDLIVKDTRNNSVAAVFFANEKGQWIVTDKEISADTDAWSHSYSLRRSDEDRTVYLMSCGINAKGTWYWGDPETGINAARRDNNNEVMYNLSGQRVKAESGLVIKQGQKILKK